MSKSLPLYKFPVLISLIAAIFSLPLTITAVFTQTNPYGKAAVPALHIDGDFNHNNKVDIYDYNILVSHYGKSGELGFNIADIDNNGVIDIFDYSILVKNFNILTTSPTAASVPSINKKVMLLIFNPIIESQSNRKLTQVLNWNDPDILTRQYQEDVKDISNNTVNYVVSERLEVDVFPPTDGRCPFISFDDDSYLNYLHNNYFPHCNTDSGLTALDYKKVLQDYRVCEKLNAGAIDELWMFGGPYFGFWESAVAGPNGFEYNSPPITQTSCGKLLPIMGFSYERGNPEMLEDLMHRTEATMQYVFRLSPVTDNPWVKFIRVDKTYPEHAQCGTAHYAPNSIKDYDWSNKNYVLSACDDWYEYPTLKDTYRMLNCASWDCDGYKYLKWLMYHLPSTNGTTGGKLNNWWKYITDPNNVN